MREMVRNTRIDHKTLIWREKNESKTPGLGEALPTVVIVWLVKAAQLADGAHPLVHLVLGLGNEIEGAVWGLDVEHKAVLELLPLEGQAGVHLLAAVQVDDSDGFLGMIVLVILQNVGVATHAAAAEYEPAFLPSLQSRTQRVRYIKEKEGHCLIKQPMESNHIVVNLTSYMKSLASSRINNIEIVSDFPAA